MHIQPFCFLVAFGLACAGCRSSHPRPLCSGATEETIASSLGPVDSPPRPHIGHIVATNTLEPNRTIRALVAGEVNRPGWLTIAKGTTVLGAIKRAGGFTRISASYYVRITRGAA